MNKNRDFHEFITGLYKSNINPEAYCQKTDFNLYPALIQEKIESRIRQKRSFLYGFSFSFSLIVIVFLLSFLFLLPKKSSIQQPEAMLFSSNLEMLEHLDLFSNMDIINDLDSLRSSQGGTM